MSSPYEQMDADAAAAARTHVRLASVGLYWRDIEHFYELAERYPDEAGELGDPFAAEPGPPAWSCGIDFDRWLELGLREREEGLGEDDASELLDFRKRWREVLESGALPGGRRYYPDFWKVRPLGEAWDEVDDDDYVEIPSPYPTWDVERDVARLAEVCIHQRTGGGPSDRDGNDYRILSRAYPEEWDWLVDLFGRLEVDYSWMTGVDFDRWDELLRRSESEGLTRAEGRELRDIIVAYREELWSGRHPSGYRIEVNMGASTIRYKDGEEG